MSSIIESGSGTLGRGPAPAGQAQRHAVLLCAVLVLALVLGGVATIGSDAVAQSRVPLRIDVQADGWDELAFNPRTWRCAACDPVIVATLEQSAVAWRPQDPEDLRRADSREFSNLVLTQAGYRTAFLDNLLQTLRRRFPDHEIQGSIVGAKDIGQFVFVEAHLVLRRGSDLTSMTSFTTIHGGERIQFVAMYNVFGPRALASRAIDRFLGGVSISP